MAKLRLLSAMLIFCVLVVAAKGQSSPAPSPLPRGVDGYKSGDFPAALEHFNEVLSNLDWKEFHGDAYFWIAKTSTALGRYQDAEKNLEHFLSNFPDNPYYPEGMYEKGRLLFLQGNYELSLQVLQSFLEKYSDSPFRANALYWSGESLFALGDLSAAQRLYSVVVTQYPTSFRVEAARYQLAVIEMKFREEQLLKLLKWSHEEYVNAVEEFQKKERTFEDAIASYQRQITTLSSQDAKQELIRLSERVRALEAELSLKNQTLSGLESENKRLKSSLEQAGEPRSNISTGVSTGQGGQNRARLMEIKEEALRLKEFYLELLKETPGGR
jgi:hypothetical protein